MPVKIGPKKAVRTFVAEHREASDLTQKQLAGRLGCDEMTISRWENGARVDIYTLQAIAEALWGDSDRWEDLLHHPDRPSPNQLMRQLPADDREHVLKTIKSLLKQAS